MDNGDRDDAGSSAAGRRRATLILVLFGLFIMGMSARGITSAYQAAHGGGVAGTLTLASRTCGKAGCRYTGSFVSDDGRTRVTTVETDDLESDPRIGDRVKARYAGGRAYAPEDSHAWQDAAVFVLAGAAIVVYALWRHFTHRRRPT
ncbi:hypothetical protein [Microbispora amethystogenes]|uniref:DUF3592 domain-containing protein n=1 Tax=Microbispora amethystogenes TaxID=1427754 RepID=A0ABQ4FB17_9ACTN|nr:hypothetical protein [Microbispora amethystogenes]GIH32023.1 hypothetical protein Mam01_21870 [Microbispora amethystogenes]